MPAHKKEIDLNMIESLARIGCTDEEMAVVVGCASRTIERRRKADEAFRDAETRGTATMKLSLRRGLFRIVGDDTHPKQITALIFLAKTVLGMSERHQVDIPNKVTVQHELVDAEPDPARIASIVNVLRDAGVLDRVIGSNGDATEEPEETLQ